MEQVDTSEISVGKRNVVIHILLTAIGLLLALSLQTIINSFIAWFTGCVIMCAGVLLAYRKKGDRWTSVYIISAILISAIVAGIVFALNGFK